MSKTLSVSAIENGCVIDHIPASHASHIINFLKLTEQDCQMTIGLNLRSKRGGVKDILKIEGRHFTQTELEKIAIFATGATVNEIKNFEVVNKFKLTMPEQIVGVMRCPNGTCISNKEPVKSHFISTADHHNGKLKCHYCEASYPAKTLYKQLA